MLGQTLSVVLNEADWLNVLNLHQSNMFALH